MGHIDPATGRNKRDKSVKRLRGSEGRGGAPERRNGKIVDRAKFRRDQRTGGHGS